MFEDFYFQRNQPVGNVLEDCIFSVKSDSTKENKSLGNKVRNERDREKIIMRGFSNERRVEKV